MQTPDSPVGGWGEAAVRVPGLPTESPEMLGSCLSLDTAVRQGGVNEAQKSGARKVGVGERLHFKKK